MQMVHKMNLGQLPADLNIVTYAGLWEAVQSAMFHSHVESNLKSDIVREPEKYVQVRAARLLACFECSMGARRRLRGACRRALPALPVML